MKKLPLYLCIVISLIAITAICFNTLNGQNYIESESNNNIDITSAMTHSPYIPDSISFAGEPTPINRIDTRESLSKELIINTYLHSHTIQLLQCSSRDFKIIEPILKKYNIPDDFKYLAAIESRLIPTIVSPAGAAGIWQIMKATGKELGLEINDNVDERYHIEKSTVAAAKYLNARYKEYGSWTLAAASYNAGQGAISRFTSTQQQDNYYNLLMTEETMRYVFRILAIKQILTNPQKYNFKVDEIYPDEEVKIITVNKTIENLATFAKEHKISYKALKRFNPWLRTNKLPVSEGRSYKIKLPMQTQLYYSNAEK